MKFNAQLILMLVFMAAVLIYTVWNYLNGGASPLILAMMLALVIYVGYGLIRSFIDSRKK